MTLIYVSSVPQLYITPSSTVIEPTLLIDPEHTIQPDSRPTRLGHPAQPDPNLIGNDPVLIHPVEPDYVVVRPQPESDLTYPIVGSSSGDRLSGTASADQIRGQGGNDKLLGLAGDDLLVCGRGNDRAIGANGDDLLKGAAGADKLKGGRGDDHLLGQNGDDRLLGGRGNDRLEGGKGENVVIGRAGRDVFSLHRRGTSIIRDYQDGRDRIELPDTVRLGALETNQVGRSTEIELRNQTLAVLRNVDATDLSRADFV